MQSHNVNLCFVQIAHWVWVFLLHMYIASSIRHIHMCLVHIGIPMNFFFIRHFSCIKCFTFSVHSPNILSITYAFYCSFIYSHYLSHVLYFIFFFFEIECFIVLLCSFSVQSYDINHWLLFCFFFLCLFCFIFFLGSLF